jgi:actin-related protein
MIQVQVETFTVRWFSLRIQVVELLYSSGRMTGNVLDVGDSVSHTVSIYEGFCISDGIISLNVVSHDMIAWLHKIVNERSHTFTASAEREISCDDKEKLRSW